MGLIGGMARTAVVAGTATAVSNRVSRRQAGRWAAKEEEQQRRNRSTRPRRAQYAAPPPPPQDTGVDLDKLKQLGELRDSGVLTERGVPGTEGPHSRWLTSADFVGGVRAGAAQTTAGRVTQTGAQAAGAQAT